MYLFHWDVSSCSESTEIWHADSFHVKKCPCGFVIPQVGKQGFKHVLVGETAITVIGAWNRGLTHCLLFISPNWVAPCKPAQCGYFVFWYAIWDVYSFCVKKCPCVFFKNAQKMDKIVWNSSPPPPPDPLCSSPNNVGFRSLRAKTLCVCLSRYWRRWGGGGEWGEKGRGRWTSKNVFEALLPHLWKKNANSLPMPSHQ